MSNHSWLYPKSRTPQRLARNMRAVAAAIEAGGVRRLDPATVSAEPPDMKQRKAWRLALMRKVHRLQKWEGRG